VKQVKGGDDDSTTTTSVGPLYRKLAFEVGVVQHAAKLIKSAAESNHKEKSNMKTAGRTSSTGQTMAAAAAALGILVCLTGANPDEKTCCKLNRCIIIQSSSVICKMRI
jgi:hypothetical protein